MKLKSIILVAVWAVTLIFTAHSVFSNTTTSLLFQNKLYLINFLQRLTGVMAFILIFWQIVVGSFMRQLVEKLGAWVFKFHLTQGAVAYLLIVLHPLLFVFLNYQARGIIDPFYVFTDFCVMCSSRVEFFYTLGRIAFWMTTVAVFAAVFRTHVLLRKHWRKLHVLNYLVYFLVLVHARNVGTDFGVHPYFFLYLLTFFLVVVITFYRAVRWLKKLD